MPGLRCPVVQIAGDAIFWARQGRLFTRWVSDKTDLSTLTVLTDGLSGEGPGIYYNIEPRTQVFGSMVAFQLTSSNDWMRIEYGFTDQPNGAGNFTPITPIYRVQTGPHGISYPHLQLVLPPFPISRRTGARSVTARVQTNNAGARVMVSWLGWWEEE